MVAIVEDHRGGFVLAWRTVNRREYRDALQWITETSWALRHLGYGTPCGRIVGNDTALGMMRDGRFNGENLYRRAANGDSATRPKLF